MEETISPFKRKYKYAADYGLILGGYIASFFVLDYLFMSNVFVSILEILGFLGTPFLCYRLAKQYRNKAWGGYIRFGQVWAFGVLLFFFASLLTSVLYYVRFQFLQPDYIAEYYKQMLLLAKAMHYSKEQMDVLTSNGIPNAIQLVVASLWLYVVSGAVLFLFISPMVARKKEDNAQEFDPKNESTPYSENSSESK